MATNYSGPSARETIQSHALAKEIITRSKDRATVLDTGELALLKRFVAGPLSKKEILKDVDMVDSEGARAGSRAHNKGSLVGFIIANSVAGNEFLNDEEMSQLRTWFAQL
jgi:hypothetical protein